MCIICRFNAAIESMRTAVPSASPIHDGAVPYLEVIALRAYAVNDECGGSPEQQAHYAWHHMSDHPLPVAWDVVREAELAVPYGWGTGDDVTHAEDLV